MAARTPARKLAGGAACRQRGAAAIEFALVISLMLMLLAGLVGLGAVFWAKQRLAGVASQSAQAALWGAARAQPRDDVVRLACDSAGREMGPDRVSCSPPYDDCPVADEAAGAACIQVQVDFPECGWGLAPGVPAACVRVRIAMAEQGWPLIGMARSLADAAGVSDWLPDVLTVRALLQIPPLSPSEPEPAT